MPLSVRFGGRSLFKPGSFTVVDLTALNNILLGGAEGVVGVVGEATGGEPNKLLVFSNHTDMVAELIGGNLAEMAPALFFPAKETSIAGAQQVIVVKTNQSTQASLDLKDSGAVVQLTVKSKVWGAPGNFTHAAIAAGVDGGVILTAGRDSDPLSGVTQAHAEMGRTAGSPNKDAWLKLWWDKSETTADRTGATITYDPSGDSLISAFTGGTTSGDSGILNFTAGNDGALSTHTIETLIAIINTKRGWHATILRPERLTVSAREGDDATAVSVFNASGSAVFWDMMGSIYDLVTEINATSVFLTATKPTPPATVQNVAVLAKTFLAGGTLGTSSSANMDSALDLIRKADVRILASGFDKDVGVVLIATINGKFLSHAQTVNGVDSVSERLVAISDASPTTRAGVEAAARAIDHPDVHMVVQKVRREDHTGVIKDLDPHVGAAMVAGMRAGSAVGTPLTHKFIRVTDVKQVQSDWDPMKAADIEALVKAGVVVFETVPGRGFRVLRDRSTQSKLDNDALTANEIRDEIRFLKRTLRDSLEPLFVGAKGRGVVTASQIRDRLDDILGALSDPASPDQILVSGTDATGSPVRPYRNLRVTISGDTVTIAVEVTFAQGVNFLLTTVTATPLRAAA